MEKIEEKPVTAAPVEKQTQTPQEKPADPEKPAPEVKKDGDETKEKEGEKVRFGVASLVCV